MNFTIYWEKKLARAKKNFFFFKVSCGFNLIKGFVATVQSLVLKFKIIKKKKKKIWQPYYDLCINYNYMQYIAIYCGVFDNN